MPAHESKPEGKPGFFEQVGHEWDDGYAMGRYGIDSPQFKAARDVSNNDWDRNGGEGNALPFFLGSFPGFVAGEVSSLFDIWQD